MSGFRRFIENVLTKILQMINSQFIKKVLYATITTCSRLQIIFTVEQNNRIELIPIPKRSIKNLNNRAATKLNAYTINER